MTDHVKLEAAARVLLADADNLISVVPHDEFMRRCDDLRAALEADPTQDTRAPWDRVSKLTGKPIPQDSAPGDVDWTAESVRLALLCPDDLCTNDPLCDEECTDNQCRHDIAAVAAGLAKAHAAGGAERDREWREVIEDEIGIRQSRTDGSGLTARVLFAILAKLPEAEVPAVEPARQSDEDETNSTAHGRLR